MVAAAAAILELWDHVIANIFSPIPCTFNVAISLSLSPWVHSNAYDFPISEMPPLFPLLRLPSLLPFSYTVSVYISEKEMAPHSSGVTLAWKIPWTEEPGRLQSMGSRRVGHDWMTSLSLFTFMHWRRKWQPTPVFLPRESQGWGCTELYIISVYIYLLCIPSSFTCNLASDFITSKKHLTIRSPLPSWLANTIKTFQFFFFSFVSLLHLMASVINPRSFFKLHSLVIQDSICSWTSSHLLDFLCLFLWAFFPLPTFSVPQPWLTAPPSLHPPGGFSLSRCSNWHLNIGKSEYACPNQNSSPASHANTSPQLDTSPIMFHWLPWTHPKQSIINPLKSILPCDFPLPPHPT